RRGTIERSEAGGRDVAGAQWSQIVAAARGMIDGAPVGRIADMPFAGAGRIDLDAPAETGTPQVGAEHGLRRRRTANVAKADEQYGRRARERMHRPQYRGSDGHRA